MCIYRLFACVCNLFAGVCVNVSKYNERASKEEWKTKSREKHRTCAFICAIKSLFNTISINPTRNEISYRSSLKRAVPLNNCTKSASEESQNVGLKKIGSRKSFGIFGIRIVSIFYLVTFSWKTVEVEKKCMHILECENQGSKSYLRLQYGMPQENRIHFCRSFSKNIFLTGHKNSIGRRQIRSKENVMPNHMRNNA